MSESPSQPVTRLLERARGGDADAEEELYLRVQSELHTVAEALMRRERPGHTLQATALMNDAFVQLMGNSQASFDGHAQFLAVAAGAMRRLLVDHARRKRAAKRGGDRERETLDDWVALYESDGSDLLDLDDALRELSEWNGDAVRAFELRYFGGLTTKEAASAMSVSVSTVERAWSFARAWLVDRLGMRADGT